MPNTTFEYAQAIPLSYSKFSSNSRFLVEQYSPLFRIARIINGLERIGSVNNAAPLTELAFRPNDSLKIICAYQRVATANVKG